MTFLKTRAENWKEMFRVIRETNEALPPNQRIANIVYPGQVSPDVGSITGSWARVTVDTIDDGQDTIGTPDGIAGEKRYRAYGLLFVQIFVPPTDAYRVASLPYIGDAFKTAFRKYPHRNGLVFTRPRFDPLPAEKSFERGNIVVSFEYNEIM